MNSHCNNLHEQASCWCVPAEYVRPRFFRGQRLGVVDFNDWLGYHAGKQRFHNLTSHGVGILCGLRAELYPPGEQTTTRLIITRGAAYDDCGREVIVPVNQCIDVAEWFREHRDDEGIADWIGSSQVHRLLCVGLRYRECPSDPAPAPRDPCGCDAGGCEYARVREGFELSLFPATELPEAATVAICQSYQDLLQVLATGVQTQDDQCAVLQQILHGLAPSECPPPSGDGWLWLACFDVTLDDNTEQLTALGEPDNTIPQRLELLSIAALQEMLLGIARDAGLDRVGPRISGIEFVAGQLLLNVALYHAPSSDEPTNLATALHISDYFHLRLFDFGNNGAWTNLGSVNVTPNDSGSQLTLQLQNGEFDEGRYRLTVISPPEEPIVDAEMRPLLPLTFASNFQLESIGGSLALAPTF